MAAVRKVIITSAVTGAIHTPSMSPAPAVSPDEIADAAIGAAEAVPRLSTCTPATRRTAGPPRTPSTSPRSWTSSSATPTPSSTSPPGGSPHMTVEERMQPAALFKPELASLNMGSMNFGLYPMLDRFTIRPRVGARGP